MFWAVESWLSNQNPNKRTFFLLNLLLFLTFDLMLLGSAVRTMNAGLTCPDWPLCFGKVIPDYHFGVYLEWLHRAIAGFVALVYIVFFIHVWRKRELKKIRILSLIGLFFLIAQIIMGGLTVLKLLEAVIVTFHLGLATVFLFVLFVMKKALERIQKEADSYDRNELLASDKNLSSGLTPKRVFSSKESRASFFFKAFVTTGIVLVFLQILMGGLVASTYSGLVCVDFPTCNGQFFPELKGPILIQMLHRFGAYLLAALMTALFIMSLFYSKQVGLKHYQRVMTTRIFLLLSTQIFVGIMNLKYLMPAFLSVFHLALALIIFLCLIQLYFDLPHRFLENPVVHQDELS